MASESSGYARFGPGDINGFLGLMLDNMVVLPIPSLAQATPDGYS